MQYAHATARSHEPTPSAPATDDARASRASEEEEITLPSITEHLRAKRGVDDEITLDVSAPVSAPPSSPADREPACPVSLPRSSPSLVMPAMLAPPAPKPMAVLLIQSASVTRERVSAAVASAASETSAAESARRKGARETFLTTFRHPQAWMVVGIWTVAFLLFAVLALIVARA